MAEDDTRVVLQFFKALADESRLRILGILAGGERRVDELSALLDLRAPTVSHHLAKLAELDLVRMRPEGNAHVFRLNAEALREMTREILTPQRIGSFARTIDGEAWERKVLRDFVDGERLREIPASRKKRRVVLRWLAGHFESGARYPETAVNEILQRHHPDSATLRRELVGERLVRREEGIYWLEAAGEV